MLVEGKVEEELRGQLKGDWRPCNIESFFADEQQRQWQALIDQEGQGEKAREAQQTRVASQEPKPLDSFFILKTAKLG